MLAQLNLPDLLGKYVLIPVEMEEEERLVVDVEILPKQWRAYPAPVEVRLIGDEWVASGRSVGLRVPSVLVPNENNFLVNPLHADFSRLKIGKPVEFEFDVRLKKVTKP